MERPDLVERAGRRPRGSGARALACALAWLTLVGSACASRFYDHPAIVGTKAEEAAEIKIIRRRAWVGFAESVTVYLDEEPLVALRNGRCAAVLVVPGRYDELRVAPGQRRSPLQLSEEGPLELDAGQHYFVVEPVGPGKIELRSVDESWARALLGGCEWIYRD